MSRRTNSDIEEESDTPLSDIDLDDSYHTLHTILRRHIETLYARRYLAPRTRITRLADSLLDETLFIKKSERPDHFRERLRLSPATFDRLVDVLELDEVFSNNSESQQAPVERQLAVALYWFGHDGNAASQQSVADWAGIGKGTVALWTRRVITAVLRPGFLRKYVRYPTDEEKEEARRWVEKHSCPAWRGGWCFVDGTLVPLSTRPFWYGDSYFDRKSRYSLNIQIISLPNLRIIDFSYGHTGSAHDATAWLGTRMARDHALFLRPGEWIWADSAYPIRFWIISPYKAPERYLPDNDEFNKVVSKLRIRSEHAIGFLKGRFWSLKNLRVVIRDAASHRFATYWIAACIAIHTFAMECEAEEKGEQEEEDPFVEQGLDSEDSDAEDDAQRQETPLLWSHVPPPSPEIAPLQLNPFISPDACPDSQTLPIEVNVSTTTSSYSLPSFLDMSSDHGICSNCWSNGTGLARSQGCLGGVLAWIRSVWARWMYVLW
ncbi:DDE Tnp4 domain-containing protein [Mycena kentingensis (nom. inval.)]|nr:DDE Tnp4 domain-containing protein [Mycena kentingensis (nom. inval.)]